MKREVVITSDGSKTIYLEELDEHYHSSHGAIQEALHVFIENGLKNCHQEELSIFEMGFGTGLNAALTLIHADKKEILYHGIEAYPVSVEMAKEMEYPDLIDGLDSKIYIKLHESPWNEEVGISDKFRLKKIEQKIEDFNEEISKFDLVYFDAFGFRAQSDMWNMNVLEKMYNMLKPGGSLITYAARGQFKRDLKSLGFSVKSLPGPPGKREMTVGLKA